MQELQVIDEQKINKIYELVTTDEFTRESFEKDLQEATAKYKGYIATASTLKADKDKRAEFNKLIESKHRIRIDTKNLLSETANTWDDYAKAVIKPFEDIVSDFDKGIKEIEKHQKAVRLDTVKTYLANKAAEYMLDPRIFDAKAQEYIKVADFMADGMTLKKVTMKSLDDMVTFEYQKQQEHEKAKAVISGQCAEYGMNDQPYIRQLRDLSLAEVLEQIKADYRFDQEMKAAEAAEAARLEREKAEIEKANQERAEIQQDLPQIDPETGEILDGGQLSQNDTENGSKQYKQKMTLEVYFEDTTEKEYFKTGLSQLGFEYKKNYQVSGYREIKPLTQEELAEQCGW